VRWALRSEHAPANRQLNGAVRQKALCQITDEVCKGALGDGPIAGNEVDEPFGTDEQLQLWIDISLPVWEMARDVPPLKTTGDVP
jgi:hypothetical protein